MKHSKYIVGSLALCFTAITHADTLFDWDFSGLPLPTADSDLADQSLLAASENNAITNLTTTDIFGRGTLESTTATSSSASAGELNLMRWDGNGSSGTSNGTPNGYFEFTITAAENFQINLDSISISEWRNGAFAPPNIGFQVNIDGAGYTIYDAYKEDNTAGGGSFSNFTFTETITGASEIVIRFAPVGAIGVDGGGNLHINALSATGTVSAIPEPSSFALAAGVLALGSVMLRRRS
ncbi:hypothetical protein QEH52_13110 [Coraliomargarita sp. SDUM461003]|uniref:PEP-CTERM protein-sorting domain-containing protein n=1 Tax=Thalassobacterium maritimum TaxID=3041265 RepID=A0ABU1AWC5_9BACT|nr:hypothetical protein [Coraliomargarita sp. SDUM461003]MDQ8208456.1 hypothetical protein [Coraliomargarita sp. SDUM461003]